MTGVDRTRLINRLADLIEKNADELARLESLDNGKPYAMATPRIWPRPSPAIAITPAGRTKSGARPFPSVAIFLLHAARTRGRGGADYSLEFPAAHAGLEARAGAGCRQHRV